MIFQLTDLSTALLIGNHPRSRIQDAPLRSTHHLNHVRRHLRSLQDCCVLHLSFHAAQATILDMKETFQLLSDKLKSRS